MRLRWYGFAIWVGITLVLALFALSDFVFGKQDARQLGVRVVLSFVWPLALLSRAGRETLFRGWRKL